MRANDEVTAEHIEEIESDNDHLRAEVEVLKQELLTLKIQLQQRFSDSDYCL